MERPHAGAVAEILVVGITMVLAMRTFFVLSLRIPTASMEPTLRGIEVEDLRKVPAEGYPSWGKRVWARCLQGATYLRLTAAGAGRIDAIESPESIGPRRWLYRFEFGGVPHEFELPARVDAATLGLVVGKPVAQGDDIVRCRITAGDRVLLDRLTYNFRRPRRGEVVAFRTGTIQPEPPSPWYVKRLVALGGETVRLGDDRKVWVNGRCLGVDAGTDKGVRMSGADLWRTREYLHGAAIQALGGLADEVSPLLPDGQATHRVRLGHVFLLGDNSRVSWDSRVWGDVLESEVMGRVVAVCWPLRGGEGWRAGLD